MPEPYASQKAGVRLRLFLILRESTAQIPCDKKTNIHAFCRQAYACSRAESQPFFDKTSENNDGFPLYAVGQTAVNVPSNEQNGYRFLKAERLHAIIYGRFKLFSS
ncbi:MAG TPA: hypothetical protein VN453_04350, partial [Feifaniaceae bacterium]|nr:hypothetical protein [Feifaniaceae bacterium]